MVVAVQRTVWAIPPVLLELPESEVHVWLAALDADPYESEQMARYLQPEEHARASRIRTTRDRQRWIMARGTLRMLLGLYLDTSPRLVEITYNAQGKPLLATPGEERLNFNVSHSGDLALYAFSILRDVGIDLESCRSESDEMPVAERFFTVDETAFIASHSGPERQRAFLRCWTAKEAYLKARGLGLTTAARNHVRHVRPDEVIAPRDWTVTPIYPSDDTVGMLAVHGPAYRLRTWRWESPFSVR